MMKIQRQPRASVSAPPITGPNANATALPAAQTPTARARRTGSG